jgi:DNA ligase (NAD+)
MEIGRDRLDFEIDGIVIKLNDLAARARLGETAHHPRWALAFKFAPREVRTVVRDIAVQVGRTGVLTPVAQLEPVALGGVTVSRATLHNRDEIARLDLRVGDAVRVVRAGDVIPAVVGRASGRGRRRGRPFRMPRRCPACGAATVQDGPADRCPNGLACPAQLRQAIRHFGSRRALDIRGLGAETVDALAGAGLVRTVADLFTVRAADLRQLSRFGAVSAGNLIAAIDRARRPSLARFLYALGIPGVGAGTSHRLAAHFGTLDAVRRADEPALSRVSGVGAAVAHTIVSFFREPANRRVIDRCLRLGVRPLPEARATRDAPLSGQMVVFTGTLESMTREEAETRARQLGARTAASVGPRTTLVVAGARPGAKHRRARELGIRIVSEQDFLRGL